MRTLLAASLLALLATPTLAEPQTPGMAADIDANLWPEAQLLDEYLFDSVAFAEQSIYFEGYPLAAISDAFGGTLVENYDHRWLCYESGDLRIRFVGDWLQFEEPSNLELITVEKAAGPDAECTVRPATANPVANGDVPGIGASANELLARFGTAEIGANGRLAYRVVDILGDEESWTQVKTVYYRLADGIVDQVAYRRETRTNPYLGGWAVDNYRLRSPDAVDHELPGPITGPFKAGTLDVSFGTTTLADVTTAFGGEILSEGEAGSYMLWLCYLSDTPAGKLRTWFVSDGEMGGPEHRLGTVAVDPVDVEDEWSHGCIDAPANFALPTLDLPTIGATVGELETHFGAATPDEREHFYYVGNGPADDGRVAYQSLSYQTRNGVVTGFAIDQEVVD